MSEQPSDKDKRFVNPKLVLVVTALFFCLIAIGGFVYNSRSGNKQADTHKPSPAEKKLHTNDEAVKATSDLYNSYLPTKAEITSAVGDRQDVEPIAVQAMRQNKIYFSKDFYNTALADYMNEYQATGKVTKDEVTCSLDIMSVSKQDLASSSNGLAIVNVTLRLGDNSVRIIPVTIDLKDLTAIKIGC